MNRDIDQAREAADAAAIDAISIPEQPMIYDEKSWRNDVADLITGDDKAIEELRRLCAEGLAWRNLIGKRTISDSYGKYAAACAEIGSHIVANLLANGITKDTIGE